jgi:hypothetical protein
MKADPRLQPTPLQAAVVPLMVVEEPARDTGDATGGHSHGGSQAAATVSVLLCDGLALGFALWTICCHAVVAGNGTLRHLLPLYAATVGLALVVAWLWRRRGPRPAAPFAVTAGETAARRRALRILQGTGLALGVAGALVLRGAVRMVALWWWVGLLLGVAAVAFLIMGTSTPRAEPPRRSRLLELGLWAIAVVCVAITLTSHRPDIDDAFYVNVAVTAADFPDRALLSGDSLHGSPELPLHQPTHRIQTYELWNGALSYLTNTPAIQCFHWISASIAALFVPLAFARLFRLLTPRFWLWSTAVVVLVLVATGETARCYGNVAFVRMWHGKGIYLCVFMPLVYTYAVRFALYPSSRRWLLLAAAQIAALGCSSSAVWGAPAGALAAMCCVLRPDRAGLRKLALGALASAYVLAIGWLLKGEVREVLEALIPPEQPDFLFASSLTSVLGWSHLRVFAIASVASAWAVCQRGIAQRFAIAVPLAVWVVLLNPYWAGWVVENVTGPSHWRSLWALPVPILMTLVLTAPLRLDGRKALYVAGRVGFVLAVAAFALWVPNSSTLTGTNGSIVRLNGIGLKVAATPYYWAQAVNESVPAGSFVVAPPDISAWIPTFHHHAYPLTVRSMYLRPHRASLGAQNVRERRVMTTYAGGGARSKMAAQTFRAGLDRFDVKAVCLRISPHVAQPRAILRRAGFRQTLQGEGYEIWVRR